MIKIMLIKNELSKDEKDFFWKDELAYVDGYVRFDKETFDLI